MLTKTANVFYCLISYCVFVETILTTKLDLLFYFLINQEKKKKSVLLLLVLSTGLSACVQPDSQNPGR